MKILKRCTKSKAKKVYDVCTLDWKQKKVKRNCTNCLGRETEQEKMYSTCEDFKG